MIAKIRIGHGRPETKQEGGFNEIHDWQKKSAEQIAVALQDVVVNAAAGIGECHLRR
jgi:ribosomal protein L22